MKNRLLLVLLAFALVSCEETPTKADAIIQKDNVLTDNFCLTPGFRVLKNGHKSAHCKGVIMYVRPRAIDSNYKKYFVGIEQAKESGNYKVLPSGAVRYDLGKIVGLELPGQVSTANEEPVFFSCNIRLKTCDTFYSYKPNLEIMHTLQSLLLEKDGDVQKKDQNIRKIVDEFIRLNPEFYTDSGKERI